MTRLFAVIVVAILVACGGCRQQEPSTSNQNPGASPAASSAASWPAAPPALPDPDLSRFEQVSKDQIAEAQRVLSQAPNDAVRNGHLGMVYHAYYLHDEAYLLYQRAAYYDAEELLWPYYAAHTAAKAGRGPEARAAALRATEVKPDSLLAHRTLGELCLLAGELDVAEKAFRRVVQLDPDGPSGQYGLGEVALKRSRFEEAAALFQQSLSLDPKSGRAHYGAARAYARVGNQKKADEHLAAYRSVRSRDWPDPLLKEIEKLETGSRFHNRAGVIRYYDGRYQDAVEHLMKAIALDPGYADAHRNLALTYKNLGKPEEAYREFAEVIRLEPNSHSDRTELAWIHTLKAEFPEALTHLQQALTTAPNYAQARMFLGLTYYFKFMKQSDQSDLDKALAEIRKAVELDPSLSNAHTALGSVLELKGDRDGAMAAFEKALALDGNDGRARQHLLMLQNKPTDAPSAGPEGRKAAPTAP